MGAVWRHDFNTEGFHESGGSGMSILLIVCIIGLVVSFALKLRRGTFFFWSAKKDAPTTSPDERDQNDRW